MRFAHLLLCLLAACLASLPADAGKKVLPYRAVVTVSTVPKVGEVAWRDELAERITDRLRAKGCLAGLEDPGGTEADLRVQVLVETLERETSYTTSLAQSVSPNSTPEVRDARVARVRATLLVDLVRLPAEERLHQKRLTVNLSRAPQTLGEDVEAALRDQALEEAADRVAVVVCKAKAPR